VKVQVDIVWQPCPCRPNHLPNNIHEMCLAIFLGQ
jgi:hypothetical protein